MLENPMANIDALLKHLDEGSLAHQLVSLLRAQSPHQWPAALEAFLRKYVDQEVKRERDAASPSN